MPTPTKGPRLGGSPAHERLMLANLAASLFEHGKITTTVAKAKRLRPLAERLVTIAKRDDLAARRRVRRFVQERETFVKLFEEIAPRYVDRPGGYTRIIKTGIRKGDAAPMAIIALVEEEMAAPAAAPARKATRKAAKADAVAALAREDEEAPVAADTDSSAASVHGPEEPAEGADEE
jgi:large subunit ribosomal protein L17